MGVKKKARLLWWIFPLLIFIAITFYFKTEQENRTLKALKVEFRKPPFAFLQKAVIKDALIALYPNWQSIPVKEIDLQKVEKHLRKIEVIQNVEVYISRTEIEEKVEPILVVNVLHKVPMARVINYSRPFFIDTSGKVFHVNEYIPTRLPVITGKVSTKNVGELTPFLRTIYLDPFWKHNVGQIEVTKNGELNFFAVVGSVKVLFGKPTNIRQKLNKLEKFYRRDIAPLKWHEIKWLDVRYNNQIVCKTI